MLRAEIFPEDSFYASHDNLKVASSKRKYFSCNSKKGDRTRGSLVHECGPNWSVHVPAIQYFWFTIPGRRTENSKIVTLFCFPYLNTSNQQTVFDSNRSFGTFSHFCTVNNGLCLGKTPKCPKVTRKSKCNFFSDKSRRHSRSH